MPSPAMLTTIGSTLLFAFLTLRALCRLRSIADPIGAEEHSELKILNRRGALVGVIAQYGLEISVFSGTDRSRVFI